jgi:hypothetical protein
MLFSLFAWLLLTVGAVTIGSAILSASRCPDFRHLGDQLIVAAWLGLLIFAPTLLGVSLLLPLRPGTSFAVLATMTALAVSSKGARDLLPRFRLRGGEKPGALGIAILAAIAALDSTRLVQAFDTGLYHYQVVRWLSDYGTVPGLALLHFRFGFSSSWFALAAPFDFGPFQGRISGLLGGLAIFLALLHFGLAISRILQQKAKKADWFLAGGYPLVVFVSLVSTFEVSLSPDLPIWILTLLIGWLMLLEEPESPGPEPDHNPILPFLLALGTLSIKLSAAPAVLLAGLFFLFKSTGKLRAAIVSGMAASLLVVPFFAANLVSSGCPVFPGTLMCVGFPWGVDKAAAQVYANYTRDSSRWSGGPVPAGATAWNWIPVWLAQKDKLTLLVFCFACLIGFVALRGWRKGKSFPWVLALTLCGMAFLFVYGPNPRFGTGYLALCPALFAGVAGPDLEGWIQRSRFITWYEWSPRLSLSAVFLGIAALLAVQSGISDLKMKRKVEAEAKSPILADSGLEHRVLLPPAVARFPGDLILMENRKVDRIGGLELAHEQSNGIEYWRSLGTEQCWAVSPPCLPESLEGGVRLRRPDRGFGSGFTRASYPETAERIR